MAMAMAIITKEIHRICVGKLGNHFKEITFGMGRLMMGCIGDRVVIFV